MAREPDAEADFTLQGFLTFDAPEGYRAELIDGEIVVKPPPDGNHERRIMRIVKRIPLYLLVDRQRHEIALHCDIVRNEYTRSSTVRLGGGVKLPEPFSFTLETESFVV